MGLLSKLFQKQPTPDPFAVRTGEQLIIDTKRFLTPGKAPFYASLRPEEKLILYDVIYKTVPLANAAINIITRLVNTRPIPSSGNADVDARTKEIWDELNCHDINSQLIRQANIAGFAAIEWISDDMRRINKLVCPKSTELRVVPDKWGNIIEFLQTPGYMLGTTQGKRRTIPRVKMLFLQNQPTDFSDFYGSSIMESAVDDIERLQTIIKCTMQVFQRMGYPRFQLTLDATDLGPEVLAQRLDLLKTEFAKVPTGSDIYMPAGVEVKVIGGETLGKKILQETLLVLSNITSVLGVPTALLNIMVGNTSAESYLRQIIISFQTQIHSMQMATAAAWNRDIFPVVQRLENLPVQPRIIFQKPRLLEIEQEQKGIALERANRWWLVKAGIKTIEWFVMQETGSTEIADLQAAEKFLEASRASGEEPTTDTQDVNANANTKVTDSVAVNRTTE